MIRLQRQVTAQRDNRCPAVLILGALKGLLAVAIANILGVIPEAVAVAGAAAVVGHWYPVF